jgi:hypothetical protein
VSAMRSNETHFWVAVRAPHSLLRARPAPSPRPPRTQRPPSPQPPQRQRQMWRALCPRPCPRPRPCSAVRCPCPPLDAAAARRRATSMWRRPVDAAQARRCGGGLVATAGGGCHHGPRAPACLPAHPAAGGSSEARRPPLQLTLYSCTECSLYTDRALLNSVLS